MTKTDYQPKDFLDGEIDKLLQKPGVTIDDLLLADIISQKCNTEFEQVIESVIDGNGWQNTAVSVGSLKCDGKVKVLQSSENDINKYAKEYDLTEEQAAVYLDIIQKTEQLSATEISTFSLRNSKTPTEKFISYLECKYR